MVVLEASLRSTMLTNDSHHYIQPEPFSSSTDGMDSKSSPLALLQMTCSQIGAELPAKPPLADARRENGPPPVHPPAFKPYDLDAKPNAKLDARLDAVLDVKQDAKMRENADTSDDKPVQRVEDRTPPRGRRSPLRSPKNVASPKSAPSPFTSRSSDSGASPILRPGAEVLSGCGPRDLASLGGHRPGAMPLPLPLPAYLPGGDLASAALRPTLPGLPGLYPPTNMVSYPGLTHHRPGERCSSPYCACAYSGGVHGYGAACPAGCAQCEHAKAASAALESQLSAGLGSPLSSGLAPGLSPQPSAAMPLHSPYLVLGAPLYPPSSFSFAPSASLPPSAASPSTCSWIVDGRFCGKRFATADELMQHLRTHTALPGGEITLPGLHPAYQAHLLGAHRSPFTPPPPPLPPLGLGISPAAARYHPYAKPGTVAMGLGPPPYYSPFSSLYAARPPALP